MPGLKRTQSGRGSPVCEAPGPSPLWDIEGLCFHRAAAPPPAAQASSWQQLVDR